MLSRHQEGKVALFSVHLLRVNILLDCPFEIWIWGFCLECCREEEEKEAAGGGGVDNIRQFSRAFESKKEL